MNTQLIKKTLAALVLGSLGLVTTGAQADGSRGDYHGFDHDSYISMHDRYHYPHHDRDAYQQSRLFSQQIDARQDRQMDRIRAGMRSGSLTRNEFRELMQEQNKIRAMERHFLADGFIDAREFQRLDRALDMASRNILEEKHDRQERYAYGHHPWFN